VSRRAWAAALTRLTVGAAALLGAAALAGCAGHPAAPSLASYRQADASGAHANCLYQDYRAAGWVCLRWRITRADGSTYTRGYVN
jgi:hypothetical protein